MDDQISITLRKALGKLAAQKAHLDGQISAIEAALSALVAITAVAEPGPRSAPAAARRARAELAPGRG